MTSNIQKKRDTVEQVIWQLIGQMFQQQQKIIEQCDIVLKEREQEVAQLKIRVTELENKLVKNSHNSSKPPSSDGLKKPNPKSQRTKGERKTGGQNGHTGNTLNAVKNPDIIERHEIHCCTHCQCNLDSIASSIERRQEFEIPPIKIIVTEHQVEVKTCPGCGVVNKGKFPEHIKSPVQYGPGVKGLATYFNEYHLIPYKRLQEIFRDIYSLPFSEGTLFNTNVACYNKLDGFNTEVKNQLIASQKINFDESGMRVNKKLHWLHVACTPKLTHFEIHEKRGKEAMDAIGILPHFKGRAIHDHWKPYFAYSDCSHGLCNAHHIRELTFHEEQYGQLWCKEMRTLLLEINTEVNRLKAEEKMEMSEQHIKKYNEKYDNILNKGISEIPVLPRSRTKKRGKPKQHPTKNLWDRLSRFKKETLIFMNDFTADFTNNNGENDIRMNKVKQKVSGCFRSSDGAKYFSRIRGYVSTVKKQGLNVLDSLVNVFKGEPFIPPKIISENSS